VYLLDILVVNSNVVFAINNIKNSTHFNNLDLLLIQELRLNSLSIPDDDILMVETCN
jgi:hypothetical protein